MGHYIPGFALWCCGERISGPCSPFPSQNLIVLVLIIRIDCILNVVEQSSAKDFVWDGKDGDPTPVVTVTKIYMYCQFNRHARGGIPWKLPTWAEDLAISASAAIVYYEMALVVSWESMNCGSTLCGRWWCGRGRRRTETTSCGMYTRPPRQSAARRHHTCVWTLMKVTQYSCSEGES